jgi:rubrerythrin
MRQMTGDNLKAAFAGESQAHMRYLIFADKAEKEDFPNVARLFRAVAFAERMHATNHLKALDGISTTRDNLHEAIGGETFEVEEMYPAYKAAAEAQEEKRAYRSMDWALEAERVHAGMYAAAREAVAGGDDAVLGEVFVCGVCGWTVEGEAPDVCPVCGAKHERFVTF